MTTAKKKSHRKESASRSYLPTAGEVVESKVTKAQIQQYKIIEAAISSYGKHGISGTTFSSLAKDCKISRPLIHHYYHSVEDLFLATSRFVRQTLLNLAVEGMAHGIRQEDPGLMLDGYVNGCLKWIKLFPDQARFWLLYYYQTGQGGAAKDENSQMVKAGHDRICQIIELGNKANRWQVSDIQETAKQIQLLITGLLMSVVTENGFLNDRNSLPVTTQGIRKLLGAESS